ncbi:HAD family hydrolase [Gracilibacillus salinarum]|uniref:HAD family hydrolase n=1 Tax=Gracilibacillus salinarum TaxID=2932255 RepID=A0ABY4GKB2_9BACI|nr:HAD family hydrolase [Gracilibacillus salinarum]UOQ84621.1 HAD family hydrolase [Gracilibacillus salinarum]
MFETVLFDVDGTLIDTEYVMTKSLQKTLLEEKKLTVPIESLHFILGIPGKEAIKQFVKNDSDIEPLLSAWGKNVLQFSSYATVFPEVQVTLEKLRKMNKKLGIITSKTNEEMQNEFDHFELKHYFDVVITASDTELHKPNPEPIQKAIDILAVNKDTSIYVGDSIYDMQSALSCGVSFGLARWGALDKPEFENLDIQLQQPSSILDLL